MVFLDNVYNLLKVQVKEAVLELICKEREGKEDALRFAKRDRRLKGKLSIVS